MASTACFTARQPHRLINDCCPRLALFGRTGTGMADIESKADLSRTGMHRRLRQGGRASAIPKRTLFVRMFDQLLRQPSLA